jgi:hypothetical protein
MAASVVFSKFDARRLLGLATTRDVDELVKSRVLVVTAYSPAGQPLFDADSVRRAAERVLIREEAPPA